MILETKYNIADRVYVIGGNYEHWLVKGPLTIGKVSKEITFSPGREGETMFDNYKPQNREEESYMCVETGIGSGSFYSVDKVFHSETEAQEECDKRNSTGE